MRFAAAVCMGVTGLVMWLPAATYAARRAPAVLSSTITEVTVYADRAEVTRVARRSLGAGEHVVSFAGLPDAIDPNSIQVNGSGRAVLQDIRFERRQLEQTAHERLQQLDRRLQALRDSLTAVDNDIEHARREIEFVQSIADGLTRTESKEAPVELDPAKWRQMVEFYRGKLDQLDSQILSDQTRKRDVSRRVDRVQRERHELAAGGSKVSNDVEVTLTVRKAGTVGLELSYIVHGPRWTPLYDIRVSSDSKTMAVTYKAQVRQSTSEQWSDVQVKLSTANPQQGGSHPELQPWHLSFVQRSYGGGGELRKRSAPMGQMMNVMPTAKETEMPADEAAPMEVPTAQVETGATSVVFVPEGTSTILNDNQPSTVVVAEMQFPAHFRYSTVPKLSEYAYLKAKATNNSDYPLLPGRANVFFDNAFVTSSAMELVAPTEDFWAFLGIDEAIGVEHKLIKRFEEEVGKKTRVTFEYSIDIVNNKKSAEEIVVWDQVPISNNEEIVVECVEPDYEEPTATLKKNRFGFFEWFVELQPGETRTIPLRFSVKYPQGRPVAGL